MTIKSYRESAGAAANGLIYAGFKYDRAAAAKFITAYHAKMGFDPDYGALEVYDMVFMIADAIKKHGYTADGIRQGLAGIKDFKSIGGGLVSMDADRQSQVADALYKVVDGLKAEFTEIKP
jgi:ABC-type branched-subunit amino acid transport system substrate-binding protein